MSAETSEGTYRHGLSFIATLAFLTSFFGSRLFATLFPTVTVMQGQVHFHHFWYGIAMISTAGWLGIAWRNERLDRLYALVYGLGAGFIGDEVGLLLTFGNYQSELTYQFFVAAISFIIIGTLLLKYGNQLERDVLRLSSRERMTLLGVFLAGFSAFFFSFGLLLLGVPLALIGVGIFVLTYERRKTIPAPATPRPENRPK